MKGSTFNVNAETWKMMLHIGMSDSSELNSFASMLTQVRVLYFYSDLVIINAQLSLIF